MIAQSIYYADGYWYLDAYLFCDFHQYRRPAALDLKDCNEAWEEYAYGGWEDAMLGDYCEKLLRAFLANEGKVTQVFVS